MRILTGGGLSQDPLQHAASKNMRRLVRARREYAKTLKELFLSGPARLLLRDLDAAGIEMLEWKLVNVLDMALRLSAQIWSYQTCDLCIRGIDEFAGQYFDVEEEEVDLCQAQQIEFGLRGGDKRSVIAVLRPEIRAMGSGDGDGHDHRQSHDDGNGLDRIWAKAQVFVSLTRRF